MQISKKIMHSGFYPVEQVEMVKIFLKEKVTLEPRAEGQVCSQQLVG